MIEKILQKGAQSHQSVSACKQPTSGWAEQRGGTDDVDISRKIDRRGKLRVRRQSRKHGGWLATSRTRADEVSVSPPMSRLVADVSLHVTVIYDRREEATDGRGGKGRETGAG